MATADAMRIRLHLPEELVVSVMTVRSLLHCSACGFKTAQPWLVLTLRGCAGRVRGPTSCYGKGRLVLD